MVVHGQNECDIPTQLPVHEDTQFEALLKVGMTFDRNNFYLHNVYGPLPWSSSLELNVILLSSNEYVHLFTSSRICFTIVYFLFPCTIPPTFTDISSLHLGRQNHVGSLSATAA